MNADPLHFSSLRFSVEYHLQGTEPVARAHAEALCFEQTVELPRTLIEPGPIFDHIIGRIEHFHQVTDNVFSATVSFCADLVSEDFSQFLNTLFGIASLRAGVRVAHLDFSEAFLQQWPGPRLGRMGLRRLLGIPRRPLVCGVLKPVGLPPSALATRAYQIALGGVDLIKDDQGLGDQPFCPFNERVSRCAEAVAQANRETGRTCLYIPHLTGSAKGIYKRSLFAKDAGAGGLLLCPGLVGFEMVKVLAQEGSIGLPVMTHPSLLGSWYQHPGHGMAPAVVFGQLPRLAGADISIHPFYDGPYTLSKDDCRRIALETTVPWGHLPPIFPTGAGKISADRMMEIVECYGLEVVIIMGGGLLQEGPDITTTCRQLMTHIDQLS